MAEQSTALDTVTEKLCKVCGEVKPLSAFSPTKGRGLGRYAYCRSCASAKARAWRQANPDRYRGWHRDNRERHNEQRRERRRANPDARLTESLKRVGHNLTVADYRFLEAGQGGRCAICLQRPPSGRLHVDHDHQTGRIRGLLCGSCNKALGLFRDDPARMRRAATYLGYCKLAEVLGL
jgi:hypothetical protein